MKMIVLFTLILAALAEPAKKGIRTRAQLKSATMKTFHYGDNLLCGMCRDKKDQKKLGPCNKSNGKCPKVGSGSNCMEGWSDEDEKCQTPICDKVNCGSDGYCVGPNQCVCTALSSSDGEGGCYHLRVRGLIGAGISLVVLIVSISACAIIQTALSKKTQ